MKQYRWAVVRLYVDDEPALRTVILVDGLLSLEEAEKYREFTLNAWSKYEPQNIQILQYVVF